MTSTGPGMIYKLHRWLGCFRSALRSNRSKEQSQNDPVLDLSIPVNKIKKETMIHSSQCLDSTERCTVCDRLFRTGAGLWRTLPHQRALQGKVNVRAFHLGIGRGEIRSYFFAVLRRVPTLKLRGISFWTNSDSRRRKISQVKIPFLSLLITLPLNISKGQRFKVRTKHVGKCLMIL